MPTFRQSTEEDLPFIFNSWLKDYRKEVRIPSRLYFAGHHKLIERVLERSQCITLEEEGVIIGWIVYESDCLHYVYAKCIYKDFGVAQQLVKLAFPNGVPMVSHKSVALQKLCGLAICNPYKFYL
jgi:hypothetical protein